MCIATLLYLEQDQTWGCLDLKRDDIHMLDKAWEE